MSSSADARVAEAGEGILKPGGRAAATMALSLATFMSIMDVSIANVSIAAIAGDLGVSPNQGTSIITGFGIAMAISMPLTGWLAQRVGMVRLYLGCVTTFAGLSLACAAAPTFEVLVSMRILQGAVAGPIIPVCQALVLRVYPRSRMGFALSVLSVTTFAAPIAGPLLGGWLTDAISWRWVFAVNVPLGAICTVMAVRGLTSQDSGSRAGRIDVIGLLLLSCWIGAFQLMLDLGRNRDWFDSQLVAGLGIAAGAFLLLFLSWERNEKHRIIDLTLLRVPTFCIGTLMASIGYALHLASMVLLPLWLLQYMGYTAVMAGATLAPIGVAGMLIVPFVGRFIGRIDPRWLISLSFSLFAVSLWMRSRYSTDSDLYTVMLPSLVHGAGSALFFMPLLTLILSDLPANRFAAASGVSNFLRYLTAAVGISLMTACWTWRAAFHRSRLVESAFAEPLNLEETRNRLAAAGLGPEQALLHIDRLIEQQAHTLAANDLYAAASAAFAFMAAALWLTGATTSARKAGAATR